jgi:hypothetical protein
MKVPAFILNMNKKSWSILKTDSQNLEEKVLATGHMSVHIHQVHCPHGVFAIDA